MKSFKKILLFLTLLINLNNYAQHPYEDKVAALKELKDLLFLHRNHDFTYYDVIITGKVIKFNLIHTEKGPFTNFSQTIPLKKIDMEKLVLGKDETSYAGRKKFKTYAIRFYTVNKDHAIDLSFIPNSRFHKTFIPLRCTKEEGQVIVTKLKELILLFEDK